MHSFSDEMILKYSIIIPTLNEEILLPKLLLQISELIRKKKYNIEVIISDGGSSDSTIEIASKFTNKIIRNEGGKKENIAIGRNRGCLQANGDIIIFFNADIIVNDIELLFNEIDTVFKNNKYAAYTCAVNIKTDEAIYSDKIFMNFYNYYFHALNIIGLGMGRGECQIVKREIYDLVGGYNENIVAGEDFDFFKNVRKYGRIYFSHKCRVYESPRRYRKYGHFYIFFAWLINSIFVILKQKSLSKRWEEVR